MTDSTHGEEGHQHWERQHPLTWKKLMQVYWIAFVPLVKDLLCWSKSNTRTLRKTHDWQKISHWPSAVITKNIRWFKNLLTSQKLLENAIYPFPEIGSDGKHHSNSDMWEMLLVTLNNEAHGCTKHTKWTHTYAADGNLSTSHFLWILQGISKLHAFKNFL